MKEYVGHMEREKLKLFLLYVTGADIMPDSILIAFNAKTNEEMMAAIGHTCPEDHGVSRIFSSVE